MEKRRYDGESRQGESTGTLNGGGERQGRVATARDVARIALEAATLTQDFRKVTRVPRFEDGDRETDVEHSFMLGIAAAAIAQKYFPDLDTGLIWRFAAVHDTPELETDDVPTFDLTPEELAEKHRREQESMHIVVERLHKISPDLAADLVEYERQEKPEAVLVKLVDKKLPVAVDIVGDGVRILREDYGIESVIELREAHVKLDRRLADKFGDNFPDVQFAHSLLANQLEEKFYETSIEDQAKGREVAGGLVRTRRKFSVEAIPEMLDLTQVPQCTIRQGFVAISPDGAETRVRSTDDRLFEMTVKSGGTRQRSEHPPVVIDRGMFDALWAQTDGRQIEKTRYKIPHDNKLCIKLDIYAGHLDGLMTAEVEFPGGPEAASIRAQLFKPPVWFGDEVSEDRRYKNQNLAREFPHQMLDLGQM